MRRLCLALAALVGGCASAGAAPPASPVAPTPAPVTSVTPPTPAPPDRGIPFLASPPAALGRDRVAFKLFKFLAETGAERDTYVALPDGGIEAKALFSYRDRMSTVPVAASFGIASDGSLRRYVAWGRTSRFTTIDDRIVARGGYVEITREDGKARRIDVPAAPVGVVSGYAPMMAQDLLLRAWVQHGRPRTMALLPEGEASIESRGRETFDRGKDKVTLEHVAVEGLVWGREDAWLDDEGRLAAVVTRDAEFDHSEAAREGFEALLPQLARATGVDGVAWLAEQARAARRGGDGPIALVGATLVDVEGRPPVTDSTIVVDGDRIVAAGPRAKIAVPPGASVIDVTGKYVIPGLWDMHAHVEQVEQGAVYLAAGVTTVRDMGNILEFITGVRDAIDSGKGLGPRVLVEGLVDGEGPAALGTVHIASIADVAPTIDRLKKAGCIDVKVYSSIAPSLVKPIVAYAHAHGMRVVGHVPDDTTATDVVDAGYDSISHIAYLFDAALSRKEARALSRDERYARIASVDLASPAMRKELGLIATHRVVIDDTVSLYEQMFHTQAEDAELEPGIATLPRELEGTLGGVPPSAAAGAHAAFDKYMALLHELHARGIPVVAGTDINVPGHSLHRELELYVKAGFTPLEALQAATIVPARFMRMEKQLGTVQAGKLADLVVLDGDPLADVSNVRRTALVVARGKAYAPDELWKLVGFQPLARRQR